MILSDLEWHEASCGLCDSWASCSFYQSKFRDENQQPVQRFLDANHEKILHGQTCKVLASTTMCMRNGPRGCEGEMLKKAWPWLWSCPIIQIKELTRLALRGEIKHKRYRHRQHIIIDTNPNQLNYWPPLTKTWLTDRAQGRPAASKTTSRSTTTSDRQTHIDSKQAHKY